MRNDLGVCAVSADSGTWKPDLVAPLAGHDIVILPDADATGEVRAREAAMALHNIAASVRVVRLSGLGHKEDVSDWLDRNTVTAAIWVRRC